MDYFQVYLGLLAGGLALLQILEIICSCLIWTKTKLIHISSTEHNCRTDRSFLKIEETQQRIEDNISRRDLLPIVTVVD